MIEELMWLIGPFLDIGNIIFFLASLGQMVRSYRDRRNLGALSSTMLIGYIIASLFFVSVGFISGGYITVVLGSFNIIFWILSLYWKMKYNNKEKKYSRLRHLICLLKGGHKWGYYTFKYERFCLKCGKVKKIKPPYFRRARQVSRGRKNVSK